MKITRDRKVDVLESKVHELIQHRRKLAMAFPIVVELVPQRRQVAQKLSGRVEALPNAVKFRPNFEDARGISLAQQMIERSLLVGPKVGYRRHSFEAAGRQWRKIVCVHG